jgi:hypothetical protein
VPVHTYNKEEVDQDVEREGRIDKTRVIRYPEGKLRNHASSSGSKYAREISRDVVFEQQESRV